MGEGVKIGIWVIKMQCQIYGHISSQGQTDWFPQEGVLTVFPLRYPLPFKSRWAYNLYVINKVQQKGHCMTQVNSSFHLLFIWSLELTNEKLNYPEASILWRSQTKQDHRMQTLRLAVLILESFSHLNACKLLLW